VFKRIQNWWKTFQAKSLLYDKGYCTTHLIRHTLFSNGFLICEKCEAEKRDIQQLEQVRNQVAIQAAISYLKRDNG
jgi:hypothetical protein